MPQLDLFEKEVCPLCSGKYGGHQGVYIDDDFNEVIIDGDVVKLTRRQTQTLAGVIKVYPRAARKEFLMDYVYGNEPEIDAPDDRIIDVYICRIRKILKPFGYGIEGVWGIGYKFTDKDVSHGSEK